MKKPDNNDPLDILGNAYERFYEHIAESFHHAEEITAHYYHQIFDEAKEKVGEIKEITEEDAEKISSWVKRDIASLANHLEKTGTELNDWLGFEKELIKQELIDLLLKSGDKTTLQILEMEDEAYLSSTYRTGEVAGVGTLICDQCHKELYFKQAGTIPKCPECGWTTFHRSDSEE